MSMNLVADSGSTKTAWCLSYGNQIVKQFETAGINPFFQTEEEIATQLKETLLPQISVNDVEKVYFYGAGCADPVKNKALGEVLKAARRVLLYWPPTPIPAVLLNTKVICSPTFKRSLYTLCSELRRTL